MTLPITVFHKLNRRCLSLVLPELCIFVQHSTHPSDVHVCCAAISLIVGMCAMHCSVAFMKHELPMLVSPFAWVVDGFPLGDIFATLAVLLRGVFGEC